MKVSLSVEDSTQAWAGESMAMVNVGSSKSPAVPTRPPTPHWSQNQTWASDLENVNIQCINDLNATFDEFDSDDDNSTWGDDEDPEIHAVPLDHLEQAFEQMRAKTNKIIDEAKARAFSIVQQNIPPHHQPEAVGWFGARMKIVMKFLGYIGNAMNHAMEVMMKGVREMWMGILRKLRIGVARRAVLAAQNVRTMQSSYIEAAGSGEGTSSVPLRVL